MDQATKHRRIEFKGERIDVYYSIFLGKSPITVGHIEVTQGKGMENHSLFLPTHTDHEFST